MCLENIKRRPYKVSVALAVYNGGNYIVEQIDSILSQLNSNDELVISYDVSTDNTFEIISCYSQKDKRVRVFKNPYKNGVVKNFQNALEKTSGEIIFYADQDDVWLSGKIDRVVKCFEDEKVSVVVHDAFLSDEKLNVFENSTFKLRGGVRVSAIGNIYRLSFIGCCMAFRAKYKDVIIPIPTIKRSHDWWTGVICSVGGKMVALNESLIHHRIHDNNSTPTKRPSIFYQSHVRWIIIKNLILRYRKRLSIK